MSLKAGDIVRIRALEPGYYDGRYYSGKMAAKAGELHIIFYEDSNSFFLVGVGGGWTEPMLEPVKEPVEVYGLVYNIPVPIEYKNEEVWVLKDPKLSPLLYMPYHGVMHITQPINKRLDINIFGVGNKGDIVELVNFDGRYYLSAKYLPMCGVIERWCLNEI